MKVGTKSLLFGAHQFLIHPFFVAKAWVLLYGWTWDPRIWISIFIHDWGYWGKPNMDGEEGEKHPFFAARLMNRLFGMKWYWLVLLHSRYLAVSVGMSPSRLCWADKMAICLTPAWLYVPMVRWTGEIKEYKSKPGHISEFGPPPDDDYEWFAHVQKRMLKTVLQSCHVENFNFKNVSLMR